MSYIKCPNCGKQISRNSSSCFYCGITRSIIDQELKSDEISKVKELISQIEGFYYNHKNHIILAEVSIILVFVIFYSFSYLSTIIEYSKKERIVNLQRQCSNYGGKWNNDDKVCETEVGIIDMK